MPEISRRALGALVGGGAVTAVVGTGTPTAAETAPVERPFEACPGAASGDWTATLLELGGARPDPAYPLDGTSLAGYLLRGERLPERDLFRRVRDNRALRRGNWKYYRDAGREDHLYDLAADARTRPAPECRGCGMRAINTLTQFRAMATHHDKRGWVSRHDHAAALLVCLRS